MLRLARSSVHPLFSEVLVGKYGRERVCPSVFGHLDLPVQGGLTWTLGVTTLLLTYASASAMAPVGYRPFPWARRTKEP